ncbi:MAG: aminotransferase class IV [Eubacteriales bacterium]|nr:aminotransferase class IV [Eubacteriales bacterium]
MQLLLDEGYQFGLGAFETIAVEDGIPVFLEWHLERLRRAMQFMGFWHEISPEQVKQHAEKTGQTVLKLMVSKENLVFVTRKNHYTKEQYDRGFQMDFSPVRRNETSPLTYHKTMNYGDCILEKRRAVESGIDERIFLNTRGEICEGTTTNIFFRRAQKLYTPKKECGLLPGVMRRFVLSEAEVEESVIFPDQIKTFDECFVTNSLMGIMPVQSLDGHLFRERTMAYHLQSVYEKYKRENMQF